MDEQPVASQASGGTPVPPPARSSIGPIIGAIIIVGMLAIGALYYWQMEMGPALENDDMTGANETTDEYMMLEEEDPELAEIESQSSGDDMSSIEADLEATDLDSLDAELGAAAAGL